MQYPRQIVNSLEKELYIWRKRRKYEGKTYQRDFFKQEQSGHLIGMKSSTLRQVMR